MASEKNTIMGWVDRRLPVTENLERHLTKHPVPKKVNFFLLKTVYIYLHLCITLPPVIIAKVLHPIPFRTRKLSLSAPMVLCLKIWESRSLPANNIFYEN